MNSLWQDPVLKLSACPYSAVGGDGKCSRLMAMHYWDATLRALKRPVYGLADDDGFVYTGETDEPVYKHAKEDLQSDGAAWYR